MLSKSGRGAYDLFFTSHLCFSPGVRSFDAGSLIIPMDTTYQDNGMFAAYGLVYQLLNSSIPVYWSIQSGKTPADADFTASSEDFNTGTPTGIYGYRGGPFIINSADASRAGPIINSWRTTHAMTAHRTIAPFDAPVARILQSPPRVAVFADGNELIAFRYLNAAGIPDSAGQAWPSSTDLTRQYPGYPDVLDADELAGATRTNHRDGALFSGSGFPRYTHILILHWELWDELDPNAALYDEIVAEMRQFLNQSTHLVACCQAIVAIENSINGKFLTASGLAIGNLPSGVSYLRSDITDVQIDGSFSAVGGSVPSFSLDTGGWYNSNTIVMMTQEGTPAGTNDVLITGYIDNSRTMNYSDRICPGRAGRVTYLGGHSYRTNLPISTNPDSQGARLFLNTLFDQF